LNPSYINPALHLGVGTVSTGRSELRFLGIMLVLLSVALLVLSVALMIYAMIAASLVSLVAGLAALSGGLQLLGLYLGGERCEERS
jgi:hypothetical protein